MQPLSSIDASFLYLERPTAPMHIGCCMILDGPVSLEAVRRLLRERVRLHPRLCQRALFPPLSVSHPLWAWDPGLDIDRHVAQVELSGARDDASLGRWIGSISTGILPRDRPLWSVTVLSGLSEDRTAIVWKIHHAATDGIGSLELMRVLCDPYQPPSPGSGEAPDRPPPLPARGSLLRRSLALGVEEAATYWADASSTLLRPDLARVRLRRLQQAVAGVVSDALRPAPKTPFNAPVGPERDLAWLERDLDAVRRLKESVGGTLNDLALAVLSGALGRYLRAQGLAIDGLELRALCPVSTREADRPVAWRPEPGNHLAALFAPLPVGIRDPLERHRAQRAALERLKRSGQPAAFVELERASHAMPPLLHRLAWKLTRFNCLINLVASNAAGPSDSLSIAGRRLVSWLPIGNPFANVGVFVIVFTFENRFTMTVTVDRSQVPDTPLLRRCLEDSYDELEAAAQA